MTDTYRGYDLPEVHPDNPRGFFILDEHFDWLVKGATEEHAINQWRRNIDSFVVSQLVGEGKVRWVFQTQEGIDVHGCLVCGSLLFDVLRHADTHSA